MSERFLGRWHDTDAFFSPFWLLIALKPVPLFNTIVGLHLSAFLDEQKLIQYAQT